MHSAATSVGSGDRTAVIWLLLEQLEWSHEDHLIVDDSPFMRELCGAVLSKQKQYSLVEASSGATCLQATLNHKPDLVLMDIEMEGQSGLEICQILKSDISHHHPFVILMTAHTLSEVEIEALRLGADRVLEKPLN